MDAAEPAGQDFDATRQWGQFYALVRVVDEAEYEETGDNYDVGGLLNETIALSRFIVDNACCSEYAARLIDHNGRRQIAPILGFEQRLSYPASGGPLLAHRVRSRRTRGPAHVVPGCRWHASRSA
jgi:hypothetical protein